MVAVLVENREKNISTTSTNFRHERLQTSTGHQVYAHYRETENIRPADKMTKKNPAAKGNPGAPAGPDDQHEVDITTLAEETSYTGAAHAPRSLKDALQAAGRGIINNPTDSASEEDYDDQFNKHVAVRMSTEDGPSKRRAEPHPLLNMSGSGPTTGSSNSELSTSSELSSEAAQLEDLSVLKRSKLYAVESDDKELRAILKHGMQMVSIFIVPWCRRQADG